MRNQILKCFFTIIFFLLALDTNAKDPYFCVQKGARLEYTILDSKGKIEGYQNITIIDIKKDTDTLQTILFTSVSLDEDRERNDDESAEMSASFNNEYFKMEMQESILSIINKMGGDDSGMLKIYEEPYILPSDMKPGDKLPSSFITIKVLFMSANVFVTDREVLREESIITDSGEYLCVVIKEKITEKILGRKKVSTSLTWHSRGIGVVKLEKYDKKGRLETQEILKYKSI